MKYKMILRQEAEKDLVETCKWYNEKVPVLVLISWRSWNER